MKNHIPYQDCLNFNTDFRVSYSFIIDIKGKIRTPNQGARIDLQFAKDKDNAAWCIWPEFENESGEIILDREKAIKESGTARMWIINSQLRQYHREHIKVGTKCFFFSGRRIANCEVIEIIDLHKNPIK